MGIVENEAALQAAVAVVPVLLRRMILRVAALTHEERAQAIGELYADERLRSVAELLIDLEEKPHTQALVVGELRRLTR